MHEGLLAPACSPPPRPTPPPPHRPSSHLAEGDDALASLSILRQLNALTCGKKCVVGSGGKSVG